MSIPILPRGDIKRGLFEVLSDNFCPEGIFSVDGVEGTFDFGQRIVTDDLRLWAEWTDAAYSLRYTPSATPQEYEGSFQIDIHEQVLDEDGRLLYLADNAASLLMSELYNSNNPTSLEKFGFKIYEPESVNVDEDSNHAQISVVCGFEAWRIL